MDSGPQLSSVGLLRPPVGSTLPSPSGKYVLCPPVAGAVAVGPRIILHRPRMRKSIPSSKISTTLNTEQPSHRPRMPPTSERKLPGCFGMRHCDYTLNTTAIFCCDVAMFDLRARATYRVNWLFIDLLVVEFFEIDCPL